MNQPTLPFGKYKGRAIARVPLSYLRWMLVNYDLGTTLRTEICMVVFNGEPPITIPQIRPENDFPPWWTEAQKIDAIFDAQKAKRR